MVKKIISLFVVLELLTMQKKIEKLDKIADITYNFHEIKEDIQLCIDFDSTCDEFWMYHYRKSWKTRFGTCKWTYLKNYIDYYMICLNDK